MLDIDRPWIKEWGFSQKDFERLPLGKDPLIWFLENKKLNEADYIEWAKKYYEIPFIQRDPFFKFANFNIVKKSESLYPWTSSCYPIYIHQSCLYIACLEPVKLERSVKARFVLALFSVMEEFWKIHNPEKKQAEKKQESVPTDSPVTDSSPGLNRDGIFDLKTLPQDSPPEEVHPSTDSSPEEAHLSTDSPPEEVHLSTDSPPEEVHPSTDSSPEEGHPPQDDGFNLKIKEEQKKIKPSIPSSVIKFDFSSLGLRNLSNKASDDNEDFNLKKTDFKKKINREESFNQDIQVPDTQADSNDMIDDVTPLPADSPPVVSSNRVEKPLKEGYGTHGDGGENRLKTHEQNKTEDQREEEEEPNWSNKTLSQIILSPFGFGLKKDEGSQGGNSIKNQEQEKKEDQPEEEEDEEPSFSGKTFSQIILSPFGFGKTKSRDKKEGQKENNKEDKTVKTSSDLYLKDGELSKFSEIDRCQSIREIISFIFHNLKYDYKKLMWVEAVRHDQFVPRFMYGSWRITELTRKYAVNIDEPNIFYIAYQSKLPFHGVVVSNEINKRYYRWWNNDREPNFVTIYPLYYNHFVYGFIVCFDKNSKFEKNGSLRKAENLLSLIKRNFLRNYEQKSS